jgi:hypothetical protein
MGGVKTTQTKTFAFNARLTFFRFESNSLVSMPAGRGAQEE